MNTGLHDTPRLENSPLDIKVGENRLLRDMRGNVTEMIGYYSESQKRARMILAENVYKSFRKDNPA